jgi:phospholipase C
MTAIDRRHLLSGAAALAATGMVTEPAAASLGAGTAKLTDIDHIIILMKENRSFDHYFGTLRGMRGFCDPAARRPDGSSPFHQADFGNPAGFPCRSGSTRDAPTRNGCTASITRGKRCMLHGTVAPTTTGYPPIAPRTAHSDR